MERPRRRDDRRPGEPRRPGCRVVAADRVAVTDGGYDFRFALGAPPSARAEHASVAVGDGTILAPMPGKIVGIAVAAGDRVAAGDLLVVLEAMKMEHRIEAPAGGAVERVAVAVGDVVAAGAELVVLENEPR